MTLTPIRCIVLCLFLCLLGCASPAQQHQYVGGAPESLALADASGVSAKSFAAPADVEISAEPGIERKLTKRASMQLRVKDLATGMQQVVQLVEARQAIVLTSHQNLEKSTWYSIQVPAEALDSLLAALSGLGTVESQNINVSDVTDQFIDNQSRLHNLKQLREKLRALLARANQVKDLLAIERELARVQTQIERIETRLTYLEKQTRYSTLDLTLKQQRIYGPLGYLGRGIYWLFEKLFVIK